ncbi:FAD-dependent oxidoreductase, partial [Acinetobacter baumannii]
AWYHAYDDAVDTVARLVEQEQIACDFLRHGTLKMATKPSQMDALQRSADRLLADGVDSDVEILDAARVRAEVQSERFHGGLLYKRSG